MRGQALDILRKVLIFGLCVDIIIKMQRGKKYMNDMAEKIYQLRKKNGLSQEELADKLNVSRQTVSKWEIGAVSPNFKALTALCKFFEVELNYFLEENEISKEEAELPVHKEVEPITGRKILKIYIAIFVSIVLVFGAIIGVSIGILYLKPYQGLTVITLNRFNYAFNYIGIVSACVAVVLLITILILLIYYMKGRKK